MSRRMFAAAFAVLALARIAEASDCLKSSILPINDPSPSANSRFGFVVATVGDVNGDGVADIGVGAPGKNQVVIFSGATRAHIRTISDPDGAAGQGTEFGFAVIAVGDVNGDGVTDIAIGARGSDQFAPLPCPVDPCNASPHQGRAMLFSGANGALIRRLLPADNQFLQLGFSIAVLGDINDDGINDIAVGAPTRNPNSFGQVFAFSGAIGSVLWIAREEKVSLASFGHSIASVADLNGDGKRDLIVGANFHELVGRAYVLSGATGAQIRLHENPLGAAGKSFGAVVGAANDQSGDGAEDYLVTDPGASRAYLFNGANGATLSTINSPDSSQTDLFGWDATEADDYDVVDKKDFTIAASRSGKLWLLNRNGVVITTISDPTPGPQPNEQGFGWSLDASPNLGGDAGRDLLIGEPAAGTAYVALFSVNKAPAANAGVDQVEECAGALTKVTLAGTGSSDPDGDTLTYEWRNAANQLVGSSASVDLNLPMGTHTFTLTVSDECDTDSDPVSVTVQDTTAPALSVSLSPAELHAPNHKMVEITADIQVSDGCDSSPAVVLLSMTSNEPDNGPGDGNTDADIQDAVFGTDDRAFLLRAERSGKGSGRIYTVTYQATDESGNIATASAEVQVAKGKP